VAIVGHVDRDFGGYAGEVGSASASGVEGGPSGEDRGDDGVVRTDDYAVLIVSLPGRSDTRTSLLAWVGEFDGEPGKRVVYKERIDDLGRDWWSVLLGLRTYGVGLFALRACGVGLLATTSSQG